MRHVLHYRKKWTNTHIYVNTCLKQPVSWCYGHSVGNPHLDDGKIGIPWTTRPIAFGGGGVCMVSLNASYGQITDSWGAWSMWSTDLWWSQSSNNAIDQNDPTNIEINSLQQCHYRGELCQYVSMTGMNNHQSQDIASLRLSTSRHISVQCWLNSS